MKNIELLATVPTPPDFLLRGATRGGTKLYDGLLTQREKLRDGEESLRLSALATLHENASLFRVF